MADTDLDMPTPLEAPEPSPEMEPHTVSPEIDASVVVVHCEGEQRSPPMEPVEPVEPSPAEPEPLAPAPAPATTLIAPEPLAPVIMGPPPVPPRPKRSPKSSLTGLDGFVAHLSRCMQTPSGVDTVLLLVCYGSRLSSALINAITEPTPATLGLVEKASQARLPAFIPEDLGVKGKALLLALLLRFRPALGDLGKRLRALSALISETRAFTRIWGLLGLYLQARKLIAERKDKEKAGFDRRMAVMQCAACIGLAVLEGGAVLSGKKVMSWSPRKQAWAYRWSSRFWAAYVGLEIGRLIVEKRRSIARHARKLVESKKKEKAETSEGSSEGSSEVAMWEAKDEAKEQEQVKREARWSGDLARMLAWMPLTVHWSLEEGLVGEMVLGSLACIPATIQMSRLWKETA